MICPSCRAEMRQSLGWRDQPNWECPSCGVLVRDIQFAGQPCTLACDGKCNKAWGINNRPELVKTTLGTYQALTLEEQDNPAICPDWDDKVDLADGELGEAPEDPGTYEGECGKPRQLSDRLNKWCARECERSEIFDPGEPIEIRDYSVRRYNIAPHVRVEEGDQ